jgi:general secretion pathway protein B
MAQGAYMSNIVSIDNLKPGMVIIQITQQNGPVKIRKSGLVTSEAMVQGLSEMGVQELEIDPEQTVEIAPAVQQHRTQTQALLRGQHDTSAKFDKSLNEQFNRSLFLPTVESLPSAWKIYGKQAATFAIVILGGLAIGFTTATTERWWPLISGPASGETASLSNTVPNSTAPVVTRSEQSKTQDVTSVNEATSNETGDNAMVSAQQPVVGSSQPEVIQQQTQTSSTPLNQMTSAVQPTSGTSSQVTGEGRSEVTPASQSSSDYEGKVLNEGQEDADITVSPELMAKFNAAVKALDSQARDDTEDADIPVTTRDDIPRVDQLPVRLLTRLPTMNFSAHMYASRPSDRWVRVNGRQMGEGEWIADKVQIVNIEAQRVVLSFEDELFTMAALTDW